MTGVLLRRQLAFSAKAYVTHAPDGEPIALRDSMPAMLSPLCNRTHQQTLAALRRHDIPSWHHGPNYKASAVPAILSDVFGIAHGLTARHWAALFPRPQQALAEVPRDGLHDQQLVSVSAPAAAASTAPSPSTVLVVPDSPGAASAVVAAPRVADLISRTRQQRLAIVQRSYRDLPLDTVVELLEMRDKEIQCMITAYRDKEREFRRSSQQKDKIIAKLRGQLVKLQGNAADLAPFQVVRGPSNVKLTAKGSTALAIRRNLSNVSAASLGAILLENITQQSVCRAEVRLGVQF